jgi:RHS repeat-associated protein
VKIEDRLIYFTHSESGAPLNWWDQPQAAGDRLSQFTYDGLGRMRERLEYNVDPNCGVSCGWALASDTRYIYDGNRVIQERDGNNTPTTTYTRGLDLSGTLEGAGGIGGLLARSSGYTAGNWTTHAYYHADGMGSITYLETSAEGLAASYRYDPYGNLLSSSGTLATNNVYRFSSKEFLAASGLYCYLCRFYDPNLQRWISRDPASTLPGARLAGANHSRLQISPWEFGEAPNLYQFPFNSPLNWLDPDGLDPLGHHLVPRSLWRNLSERVRKIWNDPKNRLDAKGYKNHNGKSYGPDESPKVKCKDYTKAVKQKLDDFLKRRGKSSPEDLSDQELQDFADEIRNTTDGDIGTYNAGVAEEISESEAAAASAGETTEALTIAIEADEAAIAAGEMLK